MKVNPEMIHILKVSDNGHKTIIINKLKDIGENMLVLNEKYQQVTRNYKKELNRNSRI